MATYEMTELESAQSMFSDFHKDVYGFRPRSMTTEQWNSVEWLEGEIASLQVEAVAVFAAEEERERENIAKFEEQVSAMCASLNKDRETICRWMLSGSDADGDWDFYCFELGIPYGYFKEFMKAGV